MVTFVWICSRTLSTTGGKTPSLGTPLGAEIMQIQKNDLHSMDTRQLVWETASARPKVSAGNVVGRES